MIQGAVSAVAMASRVRATKVTVMTALATSRAWRKPRSRRTSTNTGTKIEERIPPSTSS
jgi:hypothetical protein